MKITIETSIIDFEAWGGAVDTKKIIIKAGMTEYFDYMIEQLYPDGIDATELNDLLWFNPTWVLEQIGLDFDIDWSSEIEEEE